MSMRRWDNEVLLHLPFSWRGRCSFQLRHTIISAGIRAELSTDPCIRLTTISSQHHHQRMHNIHRSRDNHNDVCLFLVVCDRLTERFQASNMNFALNISCMVEEKLACIQRPLDWTQADEAQAYERCLNEALAENGRAWADGNIRMGDYILLSEFDLRFSPSCKICVVFVGCQRDVLITRLQLIPRDMIMWLTLLSRLRHTCSLRLPARCLLRDGAISRSRHHAILLGRHASRPHLL